jgi:hypothetical protein
MKLVCLLLFLFKPIFCSAQVQEFELSWQKNNLPIEIKMYSVRAKLENRVKESGLFKNAKNLKLKAENEIPSPYRVRLNYPDHAYLVLLIKNTSSKEIAFSVSPHSALPVEASVGFDFHCLCYGHTYRVPPNETWYRIMQLKNHAKPSTQRVLLSHVIYEAP